MMRPGRTEEAPAGIHIRARGAGRRPGAPVPRPLLLLLAAATLFYILAHLAIVTGVWPVHGRAPGAGGMLLRGAIALMAWLSVPWVLRRLAYRGSWQVVILPVVVFLLARPSLFHAFTDPAYQAPAEARAAANALKADRARLTTIERAYDDGRLGVVFGEDGPPALPRALPAAEREAERPFWIRLAGHGSIVLAPAALLLGFLAGRRRSRLRLFRDGRAWPFGITLGLFFVLAIFFVELGRVLGTTPWELFLPIFAGVWAAVLGDDAYNLARPEAAFRPRRIVGLLVYGALPLVPFLLIRELGLSVVLAGTLAVMLLIGTRRGWWAAVMLVVWTGLVIAAFNLDHRSATRLELAYAPYHDPAGMTEEEAESWAVRLHQFKLFDANVLAGGILGRGSGKGHGETAPNAADDGFSTLYAAQWGWAGGIALVLVYSLFVLSMLSVAIRERSAFERSLVTGLALLITIPFWMAMLGAVRVIPLTGVVSAFAAHGGAKLLASALSVGVIAAISHLRLSDPRGGQDAPGPSPPEPAGVRIR